MAELLPPDPSLFPGRVGRYWLGEVLGSGSTGTVRAGWHPGLGVAVAIKQLSPSLVGSAGFLATFRAEAAVLARVAHPNIVAVYDYVEVDGDAFLVMELVGGLSLRGLLAAHGRLSPEQALGALAGALHGLGHAHDLGVIHRDVKPDNMLVGTDGVSKLVDFGLAGRLGVGAGTPIGTPAYISPEAIRGEGLDARCDVYSAGVVLFELLAGRVPFAAATTASLLALHLNAEPPRLRGVPARLAALCAAALAKGRAGRPPSAAVMLAELEAAADEGYGFNWAARSSLAGLVAAVTAGAELAGGGFAATAGTTAGTAAGGSEVAAANFAGASAAPAGDLAGAAGKHRAAHDRAPNHTAAKPDRRARTGRRALRAVASHPVPTVLVAAVMVVSVLGVAIARTPPPPFMPVPVSLTTPAPGAGASAPLAVYALVSGTMTSDVATTISGDCNGGSATLRNTETIGPSVVRYDEGRRSFVTDSLAVAGVATRSGGQPPVCPPGFLAVSDPGNTGRSGSYSETASLALSADSTRLDANIAPSPAPAAFPPLPPGVVDIFRQAALSISFSASGQPALIPDCSGPTAAPSASPGGERPPGSTTCTLRSSTPVTVTMNPVPPSGPERCSARASNGLRVTATCTFTEVMTLTIVTYLAPQSTASPATSPTSTTVAGSPTTTNGSQP